MKSYEGASMTYTERDARDWDRALREKDAEIARLRAALKPFAEFAKSPPPWLAGLVDAQELLWTTAGKKSITMGDFRVALKALEEK